MKKYNLFKVSLIFLFVFAISFGALPSKKVLAEQSSSFIHISSLSEIADPNGKYILESDVMLDNTFATIGAEFKGELNGNGHAIYGLFSGPIFKKIGDNAKVYNLSFEPHIEEDNTTPLKLEISESMESAEVNIGLLAGVISGAEISQIRISGAQIISKVENIVGSEGEVEYQHTLKNNTNIGILAGKSLYGTTIKNCIIENCSMNVKIGNTISENFNFGGLFGVMFNTSITNNIINLESSNPFKILSDNNKTVNIGGISGVCDDSKNLIINNVVLLENDGISVSKVCETVNKGAMFGVLNFELESARIDGFLTTFGGSFIGLRVSNDVAYNRITQLSYNDFEEKVFVNADYWNDKNYAWDYNKIWISKVGSKYPTLQCFETYSVLFNAEKSFELMPPMENTDYNSIIIGRVAIDKEPQAQDPSSITCVEFGSSIYISVNLSTENNYNEFFTIVGLELNGELIYNNETGRATSDIIDVSHTISDNTYTYKINNFNAKCEGVYNVKLSRNIYKLNVRVYDLGDEETGPILPGKFTKNSETNPLYESVIEMQYGEKYTLRTHVINTDFSDKASWFIYDNNAQDVFGEKIEFSPVEENANFYTNKVEFTFNENSELFAPLQTDEKTYFDFTNYSESEDENSVSNYDLILVYNKRVKQVKVVFRLEDGTEINNKIATLLIENKSDRLTWNEEEGVYYAKVAFDKDIISEYIISFESMETNYEFISWTYDIGKLMIPDSNEFAGIFEVSEDTEEPLFIYLEVKEYAKKLGDNLIWLWILLSIIGVGLITLVVIIIVKKKKSGGSSYKKYYY